MQVFANFFFFFWWVVLCHGWIWLYELGVKVYNDHIRADLTLYVNVSGLVHTYMGTSPSLKNTNCYQKHAKPTGDSINRTTICVGQSEAWNLTSNRKWQSNVIRQISGFTACTTTLKSEFLKTFDLAFSKTVQFQWPSTVFVWFGAVFNSNIIIRFIKNVKS